MLNNSYEKRKEKSQKTKNIFVFSSMFFVDKVLLAGVTFCEFFPHKLNNNRMCFIFFYLFKSLKKSIVKTGKKK